MCYSKGEYELDKEVDQRKQRFKRYMIMAAILLLILVGMVTVGWTYYVRGGRVACFNSDSILVEGFECERVIREPANTNPRFVPVEINRE